jgi:hypothetical protein
MKNWWMFATKNHFCWAFLSSIPWSDCEVADDASQPGNPDYMRQFEMEEVQESEVTTTNYFIEQSLVRPEHELNTEALQPIRLRIGNALPSLYTSLPSKI